MPTTAPHPRRNLVFWTATGLIGVDTILFTMVVPALPEFADRFGFSASTAALIFALFPLGQVISALAAAGLVDRAGRRPIMILAAIVLAMATLAFSLATGPELLAGARFAQGVAAGLVWTAGLAAISDTFPSDQLGFRIGLAETAGGALGLVGPVLGGALIDTVGTDATFALAAVLPAMALVPVAFLPETRTAISDSSPLLPALLRVAAQPKARVAIATLAAVAAVLALVEPLLPLDLDDRLGLSSFAIGIVFSAGLLTYFIVLPAAGRWSDRRGRRTPLIVGCLLMAGGLPFLAVGPPATVALAFAVVGAGMAAAGTPSGPLMVEAVDEAGMAGRYGLSAASLTLIFAGGYTIGPLFGALASAAVSFRTIVLVAAAGCLALCAWLVRALPEG